MLEELLGLAPGWTGGLRWIQDQVRDWYLPVPGQVPVQKPGEVDLTAAAAFKRMLTSSEAAAVTTASPCEMRAGRPSGVQYRAACNQQRPLAAGDYVIIITVHDGPFPASPPPAGLHSWSVFTNPDNDRTTGYASSSPDNFLIGAETYLELLAFESNGTQRFYILATRMALPVRSDTGQRQGNLSTLARVLWFDALGVQVWIIPAADFGPNWYAGGFSTTDRSANSPDTLAADALRGPGLPGWLSYDELQDLPG
jgi:hypothetical protein